MGNINQNANLYTKDGKLLCKAGDYPKNIILTTIGSKVVKQNGPYVSVKTFGLQKRNR